MGTTPPTQACAVCFVSFCAETKFKKGASDRNSPTGLPTPTKQNNNNNNNKKKQNKQATTLIIVTINTQLQRLLMGL